MKYNVKKKKVAIFLCEVAWCIFHWYESCSPTTPPSLRRSSSGQAEAHGGCDCTFLEKMSVYRAVERHTSPSWYWALAGGSKWWSWPLKLSLWNSCVMTDRDFPLVSGRKRPTYRAESRQTAPKGTKQYSRSPLCKGRNNTLSEFIKNLHLNSMHHNQQDKRKSHRHPDRKPTFLQVITERHYK